ncbi:MAG TPA: ABC transporter ATP-binding protein [Thermoleophilia bacterium]|nr:ABC transporter ATP-binding protein [Thermoleophilia bacterium]
MADPRKQGFVKRAVTLLRLLPVRRRRVLLLVVLAVTLAVLEGIGVGLLNPVLQYVQYGSVQSSGVFGTLLLDLIDALGLPVDLLTLLVFAFIPVLLRQVVYFVYFWSTARVQQAAATRMRADGFAALVNSDLPFIVGEGLGNLVSTLTAQAQRGSQALFVFLQQISTGLVIVMYVLVLLILDWRLALMAIAAIALISWLVRGAVTRSRALGAETVKRNKETFSVIGERITAIRLIKMRGQEKGETRKVRTVVQALADAQVRIAVFAGVIEVTIDPMLMFTVFAIIYVGAQYFAADLATLGLFLFILLRLNQKAKDFNGQRQAMSSQIDGLLSVNDMIERATRSRHIRGGRLEFRGVRESIRFENVSFAYSDEAEGLVLRGVDLEIPSRSQTAIVGRSGAGKSTLVDLIPRLREASAGSILFDGTPIQEFDLRSLRRAIGFMTQDAILFDDTIYNNLVYGLDRVPSREEVERALVSGYCSQFVYDLPDGLETRVGDRGVRLSGGQRQRLALARVFLQDPDILILDEPTSALDSESEEYIQKALESVRHHKTLIVIAHRLSTVQHSDQIVVLDHGSIIERGAHDELLAAEGAYHRLFDLQIYR